MVNRAQEFSNPNEINAFFQKYNASGFVNWFNKNIAGDSNWGIKISNEDNWQKLWANINILFGKKTINLVEFLCMNSVYLGSPGVLIAGLGSRDAESTILWRAAILSAVPRLLRYINPRST